MQVLISSGHKFLYLGNGRFCSTETVSEYKRCAPKLFFARQYIFDTGHMLWAVVAYAMLFFKVVNLHRVGDENILQGAVLLAVQNGSQSSNRRQWRADCLWEKMELVAAAQKLEERTVGDKKRTLACSTTPLLASSTETDRPIEAD